MTGTTPKGVRGCRAVPLHTGVLTTMGKPGDGERPRPSPGTTASLILILIPILHVACLSGVHASASSSALDHYAVHVGSWDRLWHLERDEAIVRLGSAGGPPWLGTHGETFNGTHVWADLTGDQVDALRARGIEAAGPAERKENAWTPGEDGGAEGVSVDGSGGDDAAGVGGGGRGFARPDRRRLAQHVVGAESGRGPRWNEWRYRSNGEMAAALEALHTGACRGVSALGSIGRSHLGEEIPVLEISTSPGEAQAKPYVAFIGNMHGDEPVGREFVLRLARLLCAAHGRAARGGSRSRKGRIVGSLLGMAAGAGGDGRSDDGDGLDDGSDGKYASVAAALVKHARLFLLPTMNPDGFALRRRGNHANRDLNRDFPDQFRNPGMPDEFDRRQPETAALMRWSRSVNLTAAINFHEGALVANYPWDGTPDSSTRYSRAPDDEAFRRLCKAYARGHPTMHRSRQFKEGITNGAHWYPLWGGMQDWHYIATGTMDITVEVNDDKWPAEAKLRRLWHDHRGGILALAEVAVLRSLRGHVRAADDGAPIPGATLAIEGVDMHFASSSVGFYARPVAVGRVHVTASAPGYLAQTLTGEVTEAHGATLDFKLASEPRAGVVTIGGGGDPGGNEGSPAGVSAAREEEEAGLLELAGEVAPAETPPAVSGADEGVDVTRETQTPSPAIGVEPEVLAVGAQAAAQRAREDRGSDVATRGSRRWLPTWEFVAASGIGLACWVGMYRAKRLRAAQRRVAKFEAIRLSPRAAPGDQV